MPNANTVPAVLTAYKAQHSLSGADLNERLGYPRVSPAASNLTSGAQVPGPRLMARISEKLNIPIEQLGAPKTNGHSNGNGTASAKPAPRKRRARTEQVPMPTTVPAPAPVAASDVSVVTRKRRARSVEQASTPATVPGMEKVRALPRAEAAAAGLCVSVASRGATTLDLHVVLPYSKASPIIDALLSAGVQFA